MTLPHVQLGNTATDLGQGAGTFIRGLLDQRARQEQLALQKALAESQIAENEAQAQRHKAEASAPGTPQLRQAVRDGKVTWEWFYPPGATGQPQNVPTGAQGIEYQAFFPGQDEQGNLTILGTPRGIPGRPATPVELPPGQQPRPVAPSPVITETPQGPSYGLINRQGPAAGAVSSVSRGGAPALRGADEGDERRARDAWEMIQGKAETSQALVANPQAHQQAASYLAALDVAERIPVVGGAIQAVIRNAQGQLPPEAAAYFSAFMHLAAARAFSRGGATLTRNEIDYALAALQPRPGERGDVSQMRDRLFYGTLVGAVAGNPAWQRYAERARQFGFNFEDAAGQMNIPETQSRPNRFFNKGTP